MWYFTFPPSLPMYLGTSNLAYRLWPKTDMWRWLVYVLHTPDHFIFWVCINSCSFKFILARINSLKFYFSRNVRIWHFIFKPCKNCPSYKTVTYHKLYFSFISYDFYQAFTRNMLNCLISNANNLSISTEMASLASNCICNSMWCSIYTTYLSTIHVSLL